MEQLDVGFLKLDISINVCWTLGLGYRVRLQMLVSLSEPKNRHRLGLE